MSCPVSAAVEPEGMDPLPRLLGALTTYEVRGTRTKNAASCS